MLATLRPRSCAGRLLVRPEACAAFLLLLAGCDRGDDKITVYRIPKETQPAANPQQAAIGGAAPGEVHWTAPSNWEEQPASGFRKGSFLVRGGDGKRADVSVISFPASAGGVLANVNRWREQLKLAPISSEAEAGTPMPVGGRDLFFVDLVSEQPTSPEGSKSRILGGILPLNGATWFFKMIGPDELVEAQREAFKQFLQSVHPAEAAAVPVPMMGASTDASAPPSAVPPQSALHFTLPPNWQEKPLTPMRLGSFNASAPNGKQVDVSVVSLGGMAGGSLANVNRWRGQVGIPPIDEDTLRKTAEHLQANGRDFLLVDLVSEGPVGETGEKQRIIAAMADENERSWFIKMIGEADAVASQKSAFTEFVRGLKIP